MRYEDFFYENKNEVEKLLSSSNKEDIIAALVGMVNGIEDWRWLQSKLLLFINHDDYWVAKNAVEGLGKVARFYRELDKTIVLNELRKVSKEKMKDVVQETIEEINLFL